MSRRTCLAILVCLLAALSLTASACQPAPGLKTAATPPASITRTAAPAAPSIAAELQDDFSSGQLDLAKWKVTQDGDFREKSVDVQNGRLRLRAATIGTSDETVKFLGVRSLQKVDFTEAKSISFDLDWNNQANGSYLTAGVFLFPTETNANPGGEPDWIAFEYIGVPPGENARFQVATKNNGNLRLIFTEGWPGQRTGRKIGNQRVEVAIDGKGLKVREGGKEIFASDAHGLQFNQAYLYLQMSSHSNYPAREVFFDNVVVK